MIKNIFSVLVFIFIIFFLFLVISTYFSNSQEKKINKNRKEIIQKINDNLHKLPVLINDTNNVIKFNSGSKNENIETERNFWKLFKK
jgi:predicted PurR-regulated permease PerM